MSRSTEPSSVANHILPTAANLMGLCFVILSLLKSTRTADQTFLDEFIGGAILLFLSSSLFSYASIRAKARSERYERIADALFLAGLGSLAAITVVVILKIAP